MKGLVGYAIKDDMASMISKVYIFVGLGFKVFHILEGKLHFMSRRGTFLRINQVGG